MSGERRAARGRLTTPDDLAGARLIGDGERAAIEAVARRYAIAITAPMAELAVQERAGAPSGPVGRQFVPSPRELDRAAGQSTDPIGDRAHAPVEGIVHRYPDRVLLIPTRVCPVYCRYCFRRESVGPGSGSLPPAALEAALDYIRGHEEIWEVILSGGDPLVLSARRIEAIVARLGAVDHVKVLRVHTRVPAVEPSRVNDALVRALRASGKALYVVLHVNHPDELTAAGRASCARLVDAGIPLLSQTVLLAGVNDDARVLGRLMRSLVESRIKPYYLHQLDAAPGTAHFRVPVERGRALARDLRGDYSGLCQPTYVLDIPGGFGKSPIGPAYLEADRGCPGGYTVEDYRGGRHVYSDPAVGDPP